MAWAGQGGVHFTHLDDRAIVQALGSLDVARREQGGDAKAVFAQRSHAAVLQRDNAPGNASRDGLQGGGHAAV